MSRIEDIKARLDAATPGPWTHPDNHGDIYNDAGLYVCDTLTELARETSIKTGQRAVADADLIAHAPADLRDLLAVVEKVREAHADHAAQSYRQTCATCDALDRLDTGVHQ